MAAGALTFDGNDLLNLSDRQRRKILGKDMAMIFQDPMTSLNPSFTVGFQIEEVLRQHMGMRGAAARARAIELLETGGNSRRRQPLAATRTSCRAAWRSA